MENQHIGGLFQKIKAHIQKHTTERQAVIRILNEETKIVFTDADIEIKKGVLMLKNITPLKKNEVRIKKEAILVKIASSSTTPIIDIR
jgi:hypothetical protein